VKYGTQNNLSIKNHVIDTDSMKRQHLYWVLKRFAPSAFANPKGLSVERGYYRKPEEIVAKMKKIFSGCIVSLSVRDCRDVYAVVKYLPSKDNNYHSEVHGSDDVVLLSKSQRFHLAEVANKEYMEE